MLVSPAREAAYRILCLVDAGRGFAVDLLHSRHVSALQEAARTLATTRVMGVRRFRGELDFQMERLSRKPLRYSEPEIRTILRMGVFQIQFLGKVPKPAIVNDAVELVKLARKRSAAGLVNAVLRKCERRALPRRLEEPDPETKESVCRLLPAWLFERWARHFGPERARTLAWQSSTVPPTILRITRPGQGREEAQRELADDSVQTRPGKRS